MIEKMGGAVGVWREYSEEEVEVSGKGLEGCGHYIPEERAEVLLEEIEGFMV